MDRKGKLYLVPTPIGNLKDITLRALEVLAEVDKVLAEDTRTTGKLLAAHQIKSTLQSFHQHNEHKVLAAVVKELVDGKNFALVSDAGTPGISDPGFLLVRACVEEGVDVDVLPGATALIPAIVKSGFPSDRFVFEGFLPVKKGRKTRIESWKEEARTIVFYESTHRILKTIKELSEAFSEKRKVCVCKELSKLHEATWRGSLREVAQQMESANLKGEFVVVLEGT